MTLSPVVVTGVLGPATRHTLGFALSVIHAHELVQDPAAYATDPLRRLPGAFIDEANGPGGPTIVRLRGGEEVFTQILVDGVQLNLNGGFFDFQGMTLTNVDRIEVARGPQSAAYGSSAVSGVVHYLTREGQPGPPRYEFLTEGGEASHHGGDFRSTFAISGGHPQLRYSAGVGATYNRGYFWQPHDMWTRDFSGRVDANPTSHVEVTSVFRFIGMGSNLPVRDPGASRVPLDPNARNDRDRIAASVEATLFPATTWRHKVRASAFRDDFAFEDTADGVNEMASYDFFVFDASFLFNSDFWRTKVDYVGTIEPSTGSNLTFSYGAAWEREDLFNETTGDFTGEVDFARSSVGLFGEMQARLGGRVGILAGSRFEKYEDLAGTLTPRASVIADLIPDRFRLRGSVGRAFKAPDLQQQYVDNPFIEANPNLAPETSVSWEVGTSLLGASGAWELSATFFRQTFDNLIRTVAQPGSTRQINRNVGRSKAVGVEVEVLAQPTDQIGLGANGTWIRTSIEDNVGLPDDEFPIGAPLPFRPNFIGNGFIQLALGSRITSILRGVYVGEQVVLTERFSGDRVAVDPYVLVNWTGQVRARANLALFARIRNLFDASYETAFDRRGAPLAISVGARLAN